MTLQIMRLIRFWIPDPKNSWLSQTLGDPIEDSSQKEDHPDKDDQMITSAIYQNL